MYSYFVWWHDVDGEFFRLNIATGIRPSEMLERMDEFFASIHKRAAELRWPELKEIADWRWIIDPAHTDPVIWSNPTTNEKLGVLKLSGKYPGRRIVQINYN